ncbi:hypothetical protein BGW38_006479, partial [Lunasporangiospora selenospora]
IHRLYPLAYGLIILGIVVYNLYPVRVPQLEDRGGGGRKDGKIKIVPDESMTSLLGNPRAQSSCSQSQWDDNGSGEEDADAVGADRGGGNGRYKCHHDYGSCRSNSTF